MASYEVLPAVNKRFSVCYSLSSADEGAADPVADPAGR